MKKMLFSLLMASLLGASASAQVVTVWTPMSGDTLEWLQRETALFTELFGVDVEITELALGELRERMLVAAPEGEAADLLVGIPHDQVGAMAAAGVLADMTPFATRDYLADLSGQARLAFTYDGKLIGLPASVEGPALIVNSNLVPEIPATYEELIALAKQLTTADTFGLTFDINNFYYSYTWIRSYGGYIFGRDANGTFDTDDIGLASEGAIRGAKALQELRHEHDVIPAGTDYDLSTGMFADGAVAMTYDGPWVIAAFRNAGVPVEVSALPPRADGGGWSGFMGAYGVSMNQFSNAKVNAANLAKWLVRAEAQVDLTNVSGRIPASRSAVAAAGDPDVTGFSEALETAEPLIDIPEMGRVWQPMSLALRALTESANADPETELERAVRRIRSE